MAFNVDIKLFQNFFSLGTHFFLFLCEFYYVYFEGQVTSREEVNLSFFLYKNQEGS